MIEELTEEGHEGVGRSREPLVHGHIGDEELIEHLKCLDRCSSPPSAAASTAAGLSTDWLTIRWLANRGVESAQVRQEGHSRLENPESHYAERARQPSRNCPDPGLDYYRIRQRSVSPT